MKETFHAAATVCFGIGARPRDFINAQFGTFQEFSTHLGKTIFPQPCHLKGVNAVARYLQHKAELDRTKMRRKNAEKIATSEFFVENRRLKAMVRRERMPASEVLLKHFREFPPDFLEHHGVWTLVEDDYDA